MRRLIAAAALLMSASLWAQSRPASEVPASASAMKRPPESVMYCAGFITRDAVPHTNYVTASKEAPHEDQFFARSTLLLGGPGLREGERYSLLRQVEDINREDSSPEQRKRLNRLGRLYQEVGWVTVRSVEKGAAVASFDFSCSEAVPGDIVVPFREKPALSFRAVDPELNTFRAATPGSATGHIFGSKEYLALLGAGNIVYTDFGAAKGAHPGDYLVIRRGYADADLNKIDRASELVPKGADPFAVNQVKISEKSDGNLPSHILGEMMVLNVSADSSTGLITRSFAEVQLGDAVQVEDQQSGAAAEAVTSAPPQQPCGVVSRVRRALLLGHCGK